jgi:hypothetical protein
MDGLSMTERYTHMDPTYLKNACAALDGLMNWVLAHPLKYVGPDVKFKAKSKAAVRAAA